MLFETFSDCSAGNSKLLANTITRQASLAGIQQDRASAVESVELRAPKTKSNLLEQCPIRHQGGGRPPPGVSDSS